MNSVRQAFVTLPVLIVCAFAANAIGAELKLDYSDGWSPDYRLQIDFETGAMAYTSVGKDGKSFTKRHTMINHTNVARYLQELMKRISDDDPGGAFGSDTPRYEIAFTDGESRR